MPDNAVPITKLCEHDLKAFETEEPMDAKTAEAWCKSCKIPNCDVCKNALRTGKRRAK